MASRSSRIKWYFSDGIYFTSGRNNLGGAYFQKCLHWKRSSFSITYEIMKIEVYILNKYQRNSNQIDNNTTEFPKLKGKPETSTVQQTSKNTEINILEFFIILVLLDRFSKNKFAITDSAPYLLISCGDNPTITLRCLLYLCEWLGSGFSVWQIHLFRHCFIFRPKQHIRLEFTLFRQVFGYRWLR